ncbi:MAG TPA: DUF4912 domain-containing protein [Chthoniobacterales bacterium]
MISNRTPSAVAEQVPLPKTYGAPILFAIPRDPRTIFTYWNIDWSDAFARNAPADRRVYLRVKRQDGSAETEEAIEPMLGSHFSLVTQPNGAYQVELGFYDPSGAWNVVAKSDEVTMPADASSENAEIDIATVPFHLSFQRMIDLFRASNGDAVASLVSSLQQRAGETSEAGQSLSNEEREILHAMDLSLDDLEEARRNFGGRSVDELLRKRAEALLGFGGTSPGGGLGGSSWSSGLL